MDIVGVCTARDIFSITGTDKTRYRIHKYYQVSIPPLFNKEVIPEEKKIQQNEVDYPSNYSKRLVCTDLNHDVLDNLRTSDSNWVLVDLRSIQKGLYEVYSQGNLYYYSIGFTLEKDVRLAFDKRKNPIDSLRQVSPDEIENYDEYIMKFCDFLKDRYGNNIILLELKESLFKLNKKGEIEYTRDYQSEKGTVWMSRYYTMMLDALDCFYIKVPSNIVYDSMNHFGDVHKVHYVYEFYEYARKCIDIITSGAKDWLKRTDRLYINFVNMMDGIRSYDLISRTNTVKRIDEMMKKSSNNEELSEVVQFTIQQLYKTDDCGFRGDLCRHLGKLYNKMNQNDLSIKWYKESITYGNDESIPALYDILSKTSQYDEQYALIPDLHRLSERGDGISMGFLGRAYRDGKGVPVDLDKAAEWMEKAADKNIGWAKNELFGILWKIGTSESYEKMIAVITPHAEAGDGLAMGFLGRAYRDGKGVPVDLDKAAEWMEKAADKNIGWAKNELFGILWKIGTSESYEKMIAVITPHAEAGDGLAMGFLGRAYRDGKGVPVDLDKAAEWMEKAADKNIGWAKIELQNIKKIGDYSGPQSCNVCYGAYGMNRG